MLWPTDGTTMSGGWLVSSGVSCDALACVQPERDAEQRVSALRRLGLPRAATWLIPGDHVAGGRQAMFYVKHDLVVIRCRIVAWNHAASRCLR